MTLTSVPSKTLVVGLGKTGLACVRYLSAQGLAPAVTDSRLHPPGLDALCEALPGVAVFVGGFDPEVFAAADRLVVSPGVPVAEPLIQEAMARGCEVMGDIELFAREARAPVCAITGSNGKSTVTTLVGEMLTACGRRVATGGNLGEPALDLLDEDVEGYVLELSSFQLETTRTLHADVATVLNLSPDHLDRYSSFEAYAQAKANIYRGARVAVVNRDDPLAAALAHEAALEIGFTLAAPAPGDLGVRPFTEPGRTQTETAWICRGEQRLMPVSEVCLAGRHNLANALAALAIVAGCGLPLGPACAVLRRFKGLAHRSALVAEQAGVRWYDDSKGTNPGATIAALEGLVPANSSGRAVLIAGGEAKGADFAPLRPALERAARAVVLIGRDAESIARAVEGAVPLFRCGSMKDAVQQAAVLAQPGDLVLLSPACASFDMFDNYEHRGRVFAEAVRELLS